MVFLTEQKMADISWPIGVFTKPKRSLSDVSGNDFGVAVAFFDGRGGPPARGGGNTHQFYASMGDRIQADDIQLTVQGQTISSNFGTVDSSQFNLEQLLSSGISNQVFKNDDNHLADEDRMTMQQLADTSYKSILILNRTLSLFPT